MLIVLDTNVLVSGLLNPFGAPGRLLDLALAGKVRLACDDRVLAEYSEVLARPKLALDQGRARDVLGYIRLSSVRAAAPPLAPGRARCAPDADDLAFLEVALASGAAAIVTGNAGHFESVAAGEVPVLSATEFLERWARQSEER